MIYELLEYYKKELGTYNQVFKHMKFWYYTFILSPFITGIIVISLSLYHRQFYSKFFFFILIAAVITSIFFNNSAKKVVNKLYGATSNGYMWNSYEVINIIRKNTKQELHDYISKLDSDMDEEDIKRLSELASNEAKNLKVKFPLIPSIFAALFISLWNNFINWIYSYENIKLFDDALSVFTFISLILVMIIGLLIMVKAFLSIIMDDILNRDYKKMKNLAELLSEIHDEVVRAK